MELETGGGTLLPPCGHHGNAGLRACGAGAEKGSGKVEANPMFCLPRR